jgi:hypothetical protein
VAVATAALLWLLLGAPGGPSHGRVSHPMPAAKGRTILLASGDYGVLSPGPSYAGVTIRARPGATVRASLDLSHAAHVRIEGLTIAGGTIGGDSHDVTVADSRFTGQLVIHADRMDRAGIVLERDTFAGIDVCAKCYEGRLHILGDAGRPSGIVVRDSVFGPGGDSDGIQDSADGVQIVGNEFVGVRPSPSGRHVDALQLYGQRETVIRGNYFHDVATAIMAPNGADHELIEDNVFDTGGYPFAIMIGRDNGSIIRHNTAPAFAGCSFGLPCGSLLLGSSDSQGTVIRDNVLGRLSIRAGSVLAADDHNLIAEGGGGPEDLVGVPAFAGGAHPSGRAGFRLAPNSAGRGAASDGRDVGMTG